MSNAFTTVSGSPAPLAKRWGISLWSSLILGGQAEAQSRPISVQDGDGSAAIRQGAFGFAAADSGRVCLRDALDLSASRTYDCALEILRAYKLTGNFTLEIEIVLKDMAAFDQVTFEVKPKSPLSDNRRVVFSAKADVTLARFDEIMRSIKSRIGTRH